ncbi:unnamed protein product [Arctogadus glacialis]
MFPSTVHLVSGVRNTWTGARTSGPDPEHLDRIPEQPEPDPEHLDRIQNNLNRIQNTWTGSRTSEPDPEHLDRIQNNLNRIQNTWTGSRTSEPDPEHLSWIQNWTSMLQVASRVRTERVTATTTSQDIFPPHNPPPHNSVQLGHRIRCLATMHQG